MFRQFINWLSKRWPEQYVVTKQEYAELRQELGQYNVAIQALQELNSRLVQAEAEIKRLNSANGFVANGKGSFKLER